jgi:hypothetical protein
MSAAEQRVYQTAYDRAVAEHPKGGGMLGGTARLMCAQFAGKEAVKRFRRERRRGNA